MPDVALQTFYRYFGNKDELVLAMFEESMRRAAEQYGDSGTEDPVERLRHIVSTPIIMHFGEQGRRMVRWRGRERQRLLEFFPDAVEAVYEPYRAAIASAIVDICQAAGASAPRPTSMPSSFFTWSRRWPMASMVGGSATRRSWWLSASGTWCGPASRPGPRPDERRAGPVG